MTGSMEKHKSCAAVHESNLSRIDEATDDGIVSSVLEPFVIMPQKLMDVLMLRSCSHEFSWPRRAASGEYYQVCLLCAAAYQYDWTTMRRGNRVEHPAAEMTSVRRRSGQKKPTWVPRARRLKMSAPVRYRGKNLTTWYEGVIQNISQSGVMFHGPQHLPANALMELIFEMPEEISGQKNSSVLCQARLIRIKDAVDNVEDAFGLAASILDYKFLHSK
jgi:hypothetical protein